MRYYPFPVLVDGGQPEDLPTADLEVYPVYGAYELSLAGHQTLDKALLHWKPLLEVPDFN